MSGLREQLDQARVLVAAITATTAGPDGGTTFTRSDGLLDLEENEAPVLDRRFEVVDERKMQLAESFAPDAAYFRGEFAVVVLYDRGSNSEELHARLTDDAEQIAWALCRSTNYAEGVLDVRPVDQATTPRGPHQMALRMRFSCEYRRDF